MKNIIIFGGAFDPIHNGHINMAVDASKELDADVFFVPARVSVWKSDSAPIEDKINMIELAIKETGSKRLFVSRVEADSGLDTNYSIDTVKKFKELYPEAKLYFLIGTDQVNSFHKWKSAKELSELANIIYFKRPDLELDSENISEYCMKEISGVQVDASSTDIREFKSLKTPDSVIWYMIDNNLYFTSKIRSYLSEQRYMHTLNVAKLSYEIAVSNKIKDVDKVIIAAMIHDIGKEMPIVEQKKIMVDHFKEFVDYPPAIYHQFVGAYLAKKDFGIVDPVILDAIKYHTTANSNMSDVAIIVHCADKIEPSRGFNSTPLVNSLKSSLMDGFVDVLKSNVEYYQRKNIEYRNGLQIACLNQYLK